MSVANFVEILGDTPVQIGDNQVTWEKTFKVAGLDANSGAILIFSVRSLTGDIPAPIKINNTPIGSISPYDDAKGWFTQIVNMKGADLRNGENEIEIAGVRPDTRSPFNDFLIRNVVCFYHQSS